MPIKLDIPRAWKWNSSVKAQQTQPIEGKRRKVDDFTPKSPGGAKPPSTQFEKMSEPFRNASNSVKGLFRRRSTPGLGYSNGKREFGARLLVSRGAFKDRVTITPGAGQLRLEDLERELEEGASGRRTQQRSPTESVHNASDDELIDPFADPSREGSQLSRWSTASSLLSKTHPQSHSQLPRPLSRL